MQSARHPAKILTLLLAVAAAGCGGGTRMEAPAPPDPGPAPGDPPSETQYRGVPGFDTRDYPGDDVMARWLETSPYQWVGYYLPAPCHTGTSWMGQRSTLRDMGWGIALIFVGEQDWPDAPAADTARGLATDTAAAGAAAGSDGARCVAENLSVSKGRTDGAAAADAAREEGFPEGTVVYLDVERVESVSDSLAEYVIGWTRGLLEQGYAPGLYAHTRNADRLLAAMRSAAGPGAEPRLWVANPRGFSLRRAPAESGHPATIWQGMLDTNERWGGTTLRIDVNVADRPDPSAPGGG